jgi:hypothetical protein
VSSVPGSGGAVRLDVVAVCADVRDRLVLLDGVVPELRRLQRRGLSAHVEPDPDGDRLRFRVGGPPDAVHPAAQLLAVQVRSQLLLHPGTVAPPHLVEAMAGQLGDPVWIAPVDDRSTGSAQALRDRLLGSAVTALGTSAHVLLGEDGVPGGRVEVAMTALAVTALAHPLGTTGGYLALRARVDAFIRESDPAGELQEVCNRVWTARRSNVLRTVQQLAAGTPDPLADGWRAWSRDAWQDCTDSALEPRPADRLPGTGGPRRLTVVDTGGNADDRTRAEHACTEVLGELLAACGVAPVEQYLAAHLVIEATERIIDPPWLERWTTA